MIDINKDCLDWYFSGTYNDMLNLLEWAKEGQNTESDNVLWRYEEQLELQKYEIEEINERI